MLFPIEYGKDALEIHDDAIKKGDNVLLVDDLIATGGTAKAAVDLLEKIGGNIVECAFVIDSKKMGIIPCSLLQ